MLKGAELENSFSLNSVCATGGNEGLGAKDVTVTDCITCLRINMTKESTDGFVKECKGLRVDKEDQLVQW